MSGVTIEIKISVCGKGGSRKSTVTSLLANAAQAKGLKTLVIDSDESNSGLFRMLGFDKPPEPLMTLVGGKAGIKEKMNQAAVLSEPVITMKQIETKGKLEKVMQDVARMEGNQEGYLLTGLLGEQKRVSGRITKIDFVEDHTVILEKNA